MTYKHGKNVLFWIYLFKKFNFKQFFFRIQVCEWQLALRCFKRGSLTFSLLILTLFSLFTLWLLVFLVWWRCLCFFAGKTFLWNWPSTFPPFYFLNIQLIINPLNDCHKIRKQKLLTWSIVYAYVPTSICCLWHSFK